jgi:superfamily II DNA or RNA helicase
MALWFMELAASNHRKVLFVGNRRLLVTQAANDAEANDITYGVIMADLMEGNAASSNQIASIQTFHPNWLRTA